MAQLTVWDEFSELAANRRAPNCAADNYVKRLALLELEFSLQVHGVPKCLGIP